MSGSDEYYTRREDIEDELRHYNFTGQTVYLPCDSEDSEFYKYFKTNPVNLLASHYTDEQRELFVAVDGRPPTCLPVGSFDSYHLRHLWEQADVIVTNPPYSRFTDFYKRCLYFKKKFLIVGPFIFLGNKPFTNDFKAKKISLGVTRPEIFLRPDGTTKKIVSHWYTNIEHGVQRETVELAEDYSPDRYPVYDDYDQIIEVGSRNKIPRDYYGLMGVSPSYIEKHNSRLFDIKGWLPHPVYKGRRIYHRIIIQRRQKTA